MEGILISLLHRYLNGEDLAFERATFKGPEKIYASAQIPIRGVAHADSVHRPELDPEERIHTFEEVDLVLTEELMQAEAARCMRCGTVCYFSDTERERHAFGKSREEKLDGLLNKSPL